MNGGRGVSRNIIKEVVGEFIRDQLPSLGPWVRSRRKRIAEELRIPPDSLRSFSVGDADPFNASILFQLDKAPYELIVRTKTSKPTNDGPATLEPINGSRQAIRRRILYSYLEWALPELQNWLNINVHALAERTRTPPYALLPLAAAKTVIRPYSQPLVFTWSEYTIELIVRAKSS